LACWGLKSVSKVAVSDDRRYKPFFLLPPTFSADLADLLLVSVALAIVMNWFRSEMVTMSVTRNER